MLIFPVGANSIIEDIDPTTIPGLSLWLDANDSTTTANLASTGTWLDKSGNNNHPIQTDSLLRPFVVSDVLNGKPIVRFNEDYLQLNSFPAVKNKSSIYLIWVRKYNVLSKFQSIVSYGVSGNFTDDLLFGLLNDNSSIYQINNGTDGSVTSSEVTDTNWVLESFEFDGSQTGNTNRFKRFNQATQDTSLSFSYTVPSSTANVDGILYVGSYFGGLSVWALNGDIAELFIFSELPSLSNRNALISMLVNKWFT